MKNKNFNFVDKNEFTDPVRFLPILESIPNNIHDICSFTQNLLIHIYWLEKYNCHMESSLKLEEVQLRYISEILELANSKSKQGLIEIRKPNERVASICRDFSLMVCTVLRAKGVPARLRCGFATYLNKDHFEDHWVCEYWNIKQSKWLMIDAQLDQVHLDILKIDFDPCEVPSDKFLFAGKAWELCRTGKEESEKFGIKGMNGLPFIKGNIIRDLFALAKIEMLAWDTGWGILKEYISPIASNEETELLDKLASFSKLSDVHKAIRYIKDCESIKLPKDWIWSKAPTVKELYAKQREYT